MAGMTPARAHLLAAAMKNRKAGSKKPSRRITPTGKPSAKKQSASRKSRVSVSPGAQQTQMTSSSRTTRVGRKVTPAQKTMALTKASLERLVYRWNGVKSFVGNGYYFLSNRVDDDAAYRALPLYLFDLTAVNNYSAGTLIRPNPMLALRQIALTGSMAFEPVPCVDASGAGTTNFLTSEVGAATGTGAAVTLPAPYSKTFLNSASIRLNCWGAVTKATKFYISLVRFTDQDLVPVHTSLAADVTAANAKRTDFFQSIIKPLTFNPASSTGGAFRNRMKVIKEMAFTIAPHDTSDSDPDPSVKVMSWNLKLNKLLNFVESADILPTSADTNDQADYVTNTGFQIRGQVRPTSRMYLMIRASNYVIDTGLETNSVTPSFDLSIKLNHSTTA